MESEKNNDNIEKEIKEDYDKKEEEKINEIKNKEENKEIKKDIIINNNSEINNIEDEIKEKKIENNNDNNNINENEEKKDNNNENNNDKSIEILTNKKKEDKNEEFQLNKKKIFRYIKNGIKESFRFQSLEYFSNICLSYNNISFEEKINFYNQILKIKCEKEEKNYILKLAKFFLNLNEENPTYKQKLIVRIFYRLVKFFDKFNYFSLSYKFCQTAEIYSQRLKYRKYYFKLNEIKNDIELKYENYCKELKQFFSEISDEKLNEIKEIFDNIEKDRNNENKLYIIKKDWFIYTNNFINGILEKKSNKEELNHYIFKSLELRFLVEFDELIKNYSIEQSKEISIIPGIINNFSIIDFKDFWIENEKEENYCIKDNLELNKDYLLLNEKNWNFLSEIFKHDFKVSNKFKYIKCLILENNLRNDDNYNLIRERYISIEKESNILNLKEKIYKCLEYETKILKERDKIFVQKKKSNENEENNIENTLNNLKLNIFTLDKNSNILFEIIQAYKNELNYISNPYLKEISLEDNSSINEIPISKDKIIIFELHEKSENSFIKNYENICLVCKKTLENFSCGKCHIQNFCSINCMKLSIKHLSFHKNFDLLLYEIFSLKKLFKKSLEDILKPYSNKGIIGLYNLGNTCYMNSAIQCLSNTEDLTKYFLYNFYEQEINYTNNLGSHGVLVNVYANLIKQLWIEEGKKAINPNKFRYYVGKQIPQFMPLNQQDSHEFLSLFLDNLHEDLNRISNKPYLEIKEQQKDESDYNASLRWWNYHKSRENSIITDLFHGQFKCIITCPKCFLQVINYDPFMFLGLSIPLFINIINVKVFYKKNCFFFQSSIFENTRLNHLKELAINNIPQLNHIDDINLIDAIILDKNKIICQFFHKQNSGNEIIVQYYKKGFEICLYVKENLEEINVYIYPIKLNDKNLLNNIISYPIAFNVKIDSTLNELSQLVNSNLNYLLMNNYIIKEENINILIYHYNLSGYFSSNSCKFCNKTANNSNQPICNIYETFKKENKIEDIFNYGKRINQKKIILFAESQIFNTEVSVYLNLKNFYFKDTEIFKKVEKISIYNCLDLFRNEEILEEQDMWYCNSCKESQKAFKKMEIYKPPNYLIIQFKRFKIKSNTPLISFFLNKKIDTFIDFPIQDLDLRKYTFGPEKNSAIYDLYAIIEHYGGLNLGHYIAICKNSNSWIKYNDDNISLIKDKIVSKNAYILFYKKKDLDSD